MTRTGRALLGAALGAALTLLVHPASRPFLLSAFLTPTHKVAARQRGIPKNLAELSDWMLAIGERYEHRNPTQLTELQNALVAAKEGERLDPQNAFWPQMIAALQFQLGQPDEAKRSWIRASVQNRWYDYQTAALLKEQQRLADDFGAEQSWQYAYVYHQRSGSAISMIDSYSRSILRSAKVDDKDGLLLRTASVLNGHLLRQGCQSIPLGTVGAIIAENACHPPDLDMAPSPNRHKLHLARVSMQDRLRRMGREDLADQVAHVYREADGWDAFVDPVQANEEINELSFLGIFLVLLPGLVIPIAAVAIPLWLLGQALRKVERIHIVPAAIAGMLIGIGVYAITFLPLAALATFLCSLFLSVTPKRERASADDLGPMFSFTAGTLAFVFLLLAGSFVIGISAPAVSVFPYLQVPQEYFGGSGVLLALSMIVLAMILLVAPLFAVALRVATPTVLGLALRKFSSFLAYLSLMLVVIGTPLCMYFDRQNSESLKRLVVNEPVYYLNQPR